MLQKTLSIQNADFRKASLPDIACKSQFFFLRDTKTRL